MVLYIDASERTVRDLAVELYATLEHYYDTLTQMLLAVNARIQPEYTLYPRRTEMPPGLVCPNVGGDAHLCRG